MTEIEELYRLYSKDVYRYLLSLARDRTISEDLLQETFLRVIRSINTFRNESTVKTWLLSVARHVWLDYLRKNKKQQELAILSDIVSHENIENNVIKSEKVRLILDYISKNDEKTKWVMQLRIEGFSFTEIASKLNIPENSARVIFHRGKVSVINYVRENGYE